MVHEGGRLVIAVLVKCELASADPYRLGDQGAAVLIGNVPRHPLRKLGLRLKHEALGSVCGVEGAKESVGCGVWGNLHRVGDQGAAVLLGNVPRHPPRKLGLWLKH